ncbi:MAG: hypothetical protein AB7F86_07880 [Bdellovibrionales bacterium]
MRTLFGILLLSMFLGASPAWSLVQLRAHAGFSIISPDDYNNWLSSQDIKQIYIFPTVGFSGYVEPFANGIGLGVLYEEQSIKVNTSNGGTNDTKLTLKRVSGAIYYHFVDKGFFYTGPIGAVGLTHNVEVKGTGYSGAYKYDKGAGTSFFGGWDLGFKLGFLLLGGEAGFQYARIRNLKGDTSGDSSFDLNLSGFTTKVFAGVGF